MPNSNEDTPIPSLYPEFQIFISQAFNALRQNPETRPVLRRKEQMEEYIEENEEDVLLTPMYAISHHDLRQSHIVAWSFTRAPN